MTNARPLAALALLFALGPAHAGGNEMERLARDLERALGRGSVEIHRGTAPRAATAAPVSDSAVTHRDLVLAMNRHRAEHGLPPLQLNDRLSLAAGDRVADMFEKRYFDHVSPDGIQPFVWVSRRGYRYRTVGENLAVGYTTAERIVSGWMQSPRHRENILQRRFDEIGIAVSPGAPLRGYGGPTVVAIYASR